MADVAEAPRPRNAVPLPANSFELSELQVALDKAQGHKNEDERPGKLAEAIRSSAQLSDVLDAQDLPTTPEGTEIKEVVTQGGQTVKAPVAIPADAKSGEEAAEIDTSASQAAEATERTGTGAAAAGDRK